MPTFFDFSGQVATTGPLPNTANTLGSPNDIAATAQQLVGSATNMALSLVSLAGSIVAPTITPDFPIDDVAPVVSVPDAPTPSSIVWVAPGVPDVFAGTVDIDGLMPEPFDDNPPTLAFATAPAAFSEVAPDSPAVNTSFDDPTLTVNLPAAPDLLAISVVPFDGVTLPTFTAVEPTLDVVAPSIREYVPGALYTSSLLQAMQASLQDRITNGGTGLNADVENAIWERGREREGKAQADALLKLDEQMEGLGYALPPGVYLDSRIRIITETDYAERGYSREVMIKSAELELDNVKHALTTATSLESTLIQYNNSVEQRAFDAAKYATEAGVAIYNAQVQAFGQLVEVYRAKVQVYEAEIRAQLALVEVYKAQIEAEQLKTQVNSALVQQYRVQADVALSAIEIYKAQIAGIQTKAEIEKIKVEIFGEQVRAYGAKVNAYTAGVEGFRATLEAEKTKQEVYQSSVDAYRARVEAGARQIDARIAVYRGQIDAKNAEWEGYKATIQGETARVQSLTAIDSARADLYKSQVQGYSSLNDTLTKQWQVVVDRNGRIAEVAVQSARANAELYITTRNIMSDAAKSSSLVFAQLGAAALNTMNWSNSISNSFGTSNSYNSGDSKGINYSYGFSESYNHNLTE